MKEARKHILFSLLAKCFLTATVFLKASVSSSQCATTMNTFPYNENFETSNGNWTAGGISSDWAWGTPSKAVINVAGSGSKCWIAGGLNVGGYSSNENAWLRSPCFNFTNLKSPYIKFKVFWETEGKFDGANLQYSTDKGITWQLLGGKNETNTCLTENWYNDGPIPSISSQDAWSGNIQSSRPGCFVSGGSAGWRIAKHGLPMLAGNPSVIFRFVFASNSSCNDFDGFAIDDFTIEEAPASTASFTYNCSSNLRVNFVNTSSNCPTSFVWDFGDPSSGVDNTSTAPNPTHAYTVGGNYNISLTVAGPGNTSSTFRLFNLEIIENIVASVVNPIRCYGDTTGSVTVTFVGDSSGIDYNWDTNPVQRTRTAVGLGAGDYNVTILNREGCPASAHISLVEPPPLLYTLKKVKPNCTSSNGSIDITMSGGVLPYTYSWSPNVSTTSFANNLPSGTYAVTVTDANLCNNVINIALSDSTTLNASIAIAKEVSCFGGNDGAATVAATGGQPPYSYSWSPAAATTATNNNLSQGNNAATVTDANGCKAIASVFIHQPSPLSSVIKLQNTFCGNDNGNATVEAIGGTAPYKYTWSPGSYTNAFISNLAAGSYFVVITDANGCIQDDTATIASSSAIDLQITHIDALCAGDLTASATAIINGGTPPYTFEWTSNTQIFNGNPITNVAAGTYNLKLDDAVGCSVSSSVVIKQPEALKVTISTKSSYCNLNNGSASAIVTGGMAPYTFLWTPLNTTSTITNVHAGNYRLTVADKNNCSTSVQTVIQNDKPKPTSLGNDTTLCPGSNIILSPGIYNKYRWQDNSISPNYVVTTPGVYTVEVTDSLACIIKDTIEIIGDCGFIFFPNAFTPNNDMRNDFFGPLGILSTVKDYTLLVYNRVGQLVFRSTDPFKKWDGKMHDGKILPGTYVWLATYSNKGTTNILQKGTVTVIH